MPTNSLSAFSSPHAETAASSVSVSECPCQLMASEDTADFVSF